MVSGFDITRNMKAYAGGSLLASRVHLTKTAERMLADEKINLRQPST
jgi:hypothetical protein